jgi:hypothetical protein
MNPPEFDRRPGMRFAYIGRTMTRVFLSHSSKDKPFVRDLADALEAGGEIKVWLDEREIDYGENSELKIVDGLDAYRADDLVKWCPRTPTIY